MKPRNSFLPALIICVNLTGVGHAATNQFWNANGTGGDGVWGTGPGDKNWNLVAGAPAGNTTWPDTINDVAVFQDVLGGTVTVFDPVQANGISQTGANYTLNAGTITLVQDSSATNPFINVQTGTLTLNSALAGSNGLIKSGVGNLLLTNAGTVTGTTSVSAGTLTLAGALGTNTINISSGAILLDQAGGLASTAVVTNAGTLTFNAAEAIASLTNNAGTVNGSGPLTVTGATVFNGGTLAAPLTINGIGGGVFTNANIAGTFNGATTLDGATVSGTVNGNTTSTGTVLVSGSIGGGSLSVTGGSLTLTGSSTHTAVDISASAALIDSNGGLDSNAILTNAGTLTLNAADSITSYTQNGNGVLAGTGILTATGGATLNGGTVSGNLLGNVTSTGALLVSGSIGGGSLSVTGGTLNLTGTSTHTPVDISASATLIDSNGGLDTAAILTNAGTLTVNAADSIASYTQNGSGDLAGTGNLTTTSGATLNGGTVSGNLLGNLTSTGAVLMSGSTGGGSLSVTSGTLTLTGNSTHTPVNISASAALMDSNGGLDSTAILTNAGTLTVNADDSITSYTQNGSGVLEGTGNLTATSGATLTGGTVSGTLLGNTTSTGIVAISGTLGMGDLSVTAGTLNLTGFANNLAIDISNAASLVNASGGFNSVAAITNSGKLVVNADDEVSTYVQHSGGELAGTAELTVSGGAALYGGTVSGTLNGNVITDGNVVISGKVAEGSLSVLSGNLVLSGTAASQQVAVSVGAALQDTQGGLDKMAGLVNSGTISLGKNDYIRSYLSNGGSLAAGPGVLSAGYSLLNDGSIIAGRLTTGDLTSNGAILNSGTTLAQTIHIVDGTFTNMGSLGTTASIMDIRAGATLVASGRQHFGILTTSGNGSGTWRGDLRNKTVIAPGDTGNFGSLSVDGNFSQTRNGMLQLDIAGSGHDLIDVTGKARFQGTLFLSQVGDDPIAPFVPIQLVDAASYSGNFSILTEDLEGSVWFNPATGSIVVTPSQGNLQSQFPESTKNQIASWVSLYDDVIDPQKTNITPAPGKESGYHIASGIADDRNPDLMWALEASYTPTGLDAALLNRLSPEVYASFNDYAVQATRSHLRSALDAPTLPNRNPIHDSKSGMASDAKSPSAPPHAAGDWEFFAAADYMDATTDNSENEADYSLTSSGILSGAKIHINSRTLIAGYAAFDTGSIDGELIDSDEIGWSLGVFCRTTLDEKSHTVLTAALSHGRYESDGSRDSVVADATGWRMGKVSFSNVESFSTELYLGLESQLAPMDRIRLIPSIGLRGAFATMDGFTEDSGNAPGSPIALAVEGDHQDYFLAEVGLTAETDISEKLVGWAHLGFSAGLGDESHVLEASYVQGARPMRITADGLSDDLLQLGVGAAYKISDAAALNLGYHAELHPGQSTLQGFNISTSFRF